MTHFDAKLTKQDSSLGWNYRIEVPIDICDTLYPPGNKDAKRVCCTINSLLTIQLALTPDGNDNFYIVINKDNRKKLAIDVNDLVSIEISKDESKYGIALPVEMEELLTQDVEGSLLFHKLTPGRQRTLLHMISVPKSESIRIRKSVITLEYLKFVNGKLVFKELNEAFKNWHK